MRCTCEYFEGKLTDVCAAHAQYARNYALDEAERCAIMILGKEKYEMSPCQAHPFELVNETMKELCAERDALAKDAERYRWCRNTQTAAWMAIDPYAPDALEQLDASIDAALEGPK
jgi:hypothetical protein